MICRIDNHNTCINALQAEVDALKRRQAETAELDALLPDLLERAFKGEL